jgi:hypothetical protein
VSDFVVGGTSTKLASQHELHVARPLSFGLLTAYTLAGPIVHLYGRRAAPAVGSLRRGRGFFDGARFSFE